MVRKKQLALSLSAAVLSGLLVYGVYKLQLRQIRMRESVDVIVPRQFIPTGTTLTRDMLKTLKLPREAVSAEMVTSIVADVGTVAALDTRPRAWTGADVGTLQDLAGCAAAALALRASGRHYRHVAEQNQRLTQELEHRVGNNLAALSGLVSVLEGRAKDVRSFGAAVRERLAGISHVHRLLGTAGVERIELASLVRSLAEAIEPTAPHRAVVRVSGPAVTLDAKRVLPLAMILVEWFSNSAKYGAHSEPGGRVEVTWEVTAGRCVVLRWREQDGPRIESVGARSLGTMLVEGFAQRDLGGSVRVEYPGDGARYELEFAVEGGMKCGERG